ncbi:MAG: carboxylating nicotinate-nucleotide diphosphorylase [Promethearchaeota archaeon]
MNYNKILIERKIREFLEEDCSFKDISSEFILDNVQINARIIAKSAGYISGLEEFKILLKILGLDGNFLKKDGDEIKNGDVIVEIKGQPKDILLGERVGLNILTRMSSITTTTKKMVNLVKKLEKKTKIACTRKTTPGFRIFEKKAVDIGGGETHRFSLDDMILLKDTHLRYYNGDIEKLIKDVKKIASFSKKIEIEIEKPEDVIIAAKNGADIIMLDNMTPEQVRDTIELLKKNELREKVLIEVSGGINEGNLPNYLEAEPDIISTSKLTMFPSEQIDLTLRFF